MSRERPEKDRFLGTKIDSIWENTLSHCLLRGRAMSTASATIEFRAKTPFSAPAALGGAAAPSLGLEVLAAARGRKTDVQTLAVRARALDSGTARHFPPVWLPRRSPPRSALPPRKGKSVGRPERSSISRITTGPESAGPTACCSHGMPARRLRSWT